jgi:TPR repeat protein
LYALNPLTATGSSPLCARCDHRFQLLAGFINNMQHIFVRQCQGIAISILCIDLLLATFIVASLSKDGATSTPDRFDLKSKLVDQIGISVRPAEQFYFLHSKALLGDVSATRELASRLYTGIGISANVAEAARFWTEAAKRDDKEAEFCLGILYAKGQGVNQSNLQAYRWLLLAEQGNSDYSLLASKLLKQLDAITDETTRSQARVLASEHLVAKRSH